MDGEAEDGKLGPAKDALRESFTLAANSLTTLYKKSKENKNVGAREVVTAVHEWAVERSRGSETIAVEDLLEFCQAKFVSYGGTAAGLKTNAGLFRRSEEEQPNITAFDEDKVGLDASAKNSREHNVREQQKDQVRCAQCPHCAASGGVFTCGPNRKRVRQEIDVEGDSELSHLFSSKLGPPWPSKTASKLQIPKDEDREDEVE
mmetsp:Transcript_3546/g.10691  ORF Transcript_3546/g.10691 Transcript_3546/m.10691 type:complete len:204 (-) Transcript_3546:385-996(-)|eukprot:CAMPEP_0198730398 /NCGR_PEP_ID=MMETSP1475-20131203/24408_1 /TAXON_ID= ORGANISM="Unidentified sp., Strain CCMP1999" /NCGR_SAMPLE_ID=MMETSP1475 /ASSEMBLY_ACC=CAM_ASM_001111 /LENGTH=203 /DNA_ID=CAMNT_0044493197 /DNA_START=161 /DNA_END=772 /DNA_ORIENTATION=-